MAELRCGNCGLALSEGEPGRRHYGDWIAHLEYRCIELLQMRITENESLEKFASYVMANSFAGMDTDGGDAQDKAEELGLLELRPIPPEASIDGETEHYFLKWAPREGE